MAKARGLVEKLSEGPRACAVHSFTICSRDLLNRFCKVGLNVMTAAEHFTAGETESRLHAFGWDAVQ